MNNWLNAQRPSTLIGLAGLAVRRGQTRDAGIGGNTQTQVPSYFQDIRHILAAMHDFVLRDVPHVRSLSDHGVELRQSYRGSTLYLGNVTKGYYETKTV